MLIYKPAYKSIVDILTSEEATFVWQLKYEEIIEDISREPCGINLPYLRNQRKFYFDNHLYYINVKDKQLLKEERENRTGREFDKVPGYNHFVFRGEPKEILDAFIKENYTIIDK